MSKLKYLFFSGKNSKSTYYLKAATQFIVPDSFYRNKRVRLLPSIEKRADAITIWNRVNYYCKLSTHSPLLISSATTLGKLTLKGNKSVYFFDSYQYIRYFPKDLKWCYLFGDVRAIPPHPTIVKSRELHANENAVLLNMDKVRHFTFLTDKKSFNQKQNKVIFRGEISGKQNRIDFMHRWFGHDRCDLGDVGKKAIKEEWRTEKISLYDHLDYKFIMTLEGNDVASNLKWVMSSNSLAVMPRPTCETWFMEGQLIPNYHYVEIKPDFSDLQERMEYYIEHPNEAEKIIEQAHEWVKQFQDEKREKLISLLVLDKYLRLTNEEAF